MRRFLKKYFIPHEENGHKPHLLRPEKALVAAGVLLALEILFLIDAFVIVPRSLYFAEILPSVLVDETNARRAGEELSPLAPHPLLYEAARRKAEDMAGKGYFAHTSPEGITPWYWLTEAGYVFSYAGENLAVNFFDSKDVADAWINSASHRANILNSKFTEIGIATARGTYQGRESVFVVQFFGRRAAAATFPLALPPAPTSSPGSLTETPPPAPSVVLSEETFVATEAPPAGEEEAQFAAGPQSSLSEQLLASPRRFANYLYLAFGAIVLLALLLAIFVRIKIQHPSIIVSGVLLLVIIASVLLLNSYFSAASIQVY